jgi:hypothetical protein
MLSMFAASSGKNGRMIGTPPARWTASEYAFETEWRGKTPWLAMSTNWDDVMPMTGRSISISRLLVA